MAGFALLTLAIGIAYGVTMAFARAGFATFALLTLMRIEGG